MADDKRFADEPCRVCGEPIRLTFMKSVLDSMLARQMCHGCDYWEHVAEKGADTVIDGCVYSPGSRTSARFGDTLGCAGRRFDIEYFDGRKCTTFDLWVQGVVPAAFRERLPDTAQFRGARRAQVGETTCWDASPHTLPPYPLPDGRSAPWQYGDMVAQAIGAVARRLCA